MVIHNLDFIDPDLNYFGDVHNYSDHSQSKYITIEEYNELMLNTDRLFTIYNYNIRSYSANSNSFFSTFDSLSCYPDVLVLTETWFTPNYTVDLPSYHSFHSTRNERRSGGVSVFISKKLNANKVSNLCFVNDTIEVCTVRCKVPLATTEVFIVAIYRPHSNTVENFINSLNFILDSIGNKRIYLLGDFNNLNILLDNTQIDSFISNMQSYHFIPLILKPTRFPPNDLSSPSLLDQIWTNRINTYFSYIIMNDFTDHLPCVVRSILPKFSNSHPNETIKISFRDKSEANHVAFSQYLESFDWNSLRNSDLNLYVSNFIDKLNEAYRQHFPMKTKTISKRRVMNPWINTYVSNLIKAKSLYFNLCRAGVVTFSENNSFKNRVNSIIKKTRREYYRNVFNMNLNNAKKTWEIIRKLSNTKLEKKIVKKLFFNNIEYNDPINIAESFNTYFSNIAEELDSEIPNSALDPISFLTQNSEHSIFLNPVTPLECSTIIQNLNVVGQDMNCIPVKLFKYYRDVYSNVLSNMINEAFITGVFPEVLKIANVTPVFKKGDPLCTSNYRPISVLSTIAKIFEKCIYSRLVCFFGRHSIITPHQYGFLKSRSTEDAVMELVNFFYDSLNDKDHALGIFVDFRKAFDTVNHVILLRKLERYGIRGIALKLLSNYLHNRQQRVKIGLNYSTSVYTNIGIPQGSQLGPLLFLIFINDLPYIFENFTSILYADDTTLCLKGPSPEILFEQCNRDLDIFYNWTVSNRLSINFDKTVFLLVTNRYINSPHIEINEIPIQRQTFVKYLGVTIDEKLKFNEHIKEVNAKVSRSIGVIYRIRDFLPSCILLKLYNSIIYPYIFYCNSIWGGTYQVHLQRLTILQKRSIRLINNADYLAHTNELFIRSKVLKLKEVHKLCCAIYLYKRPTLRDNFVRTHLHDTRFRSNLLPEHQRLSVCQHSINFVGPHIWNEIPTSVKDSISLSSFKFKFKSSLIDQYTNRDNS